ncbi:MAG: DUF4230 domain-containing protein, partial [Sphingobacteriaceae bacterium]
MTNTNSGTGSIIKNLILLVIVLCLLAAGYFFFKDKLFGSRKEFHEDVMVEKITSMGKLELVKYSMKDVIEQKEVRSILPDKRILFVAVGEVTGCIDLTRIRKKDIVKVGEDSITVYLPQPEICYVKLDHQKSKVYDVSGSWFEADTKDLVEGIYKTAEQRLLKNASEMQILPKSIVQSVLKDDRAVAFLNSYLQQFKNNRNPLLTDTATSVIELTTTGADSLPQEGYHLSITPKRIVITGRDAGLFYGVQSLIQLLADTKTTGVSTLNCMEIEDHPRFNYRGMHLDVARHFFPASFIKEYLDLLAAYKINTFHWHLTDDQGWRIEIKKYPKLTEVGSIRAQTLVGNYKNRMPKTFDNTPHGGFYTQEEIKEIVKYAANRYITIVPEIEMPGHSTAALAAYPEFSCNPKKVQKVAETWHVFNGVYNPTEETFHFLEDVLTEVMTLFPGKYIHIGGDEVPKSNWRHSKYAQNLIRKLKLKNEHGLQSYFVERIEKFLNENGRSI